MAVDVRVRLCDLPVYAGQPRSVPVALRPLGIRRTRRRRRVGGASRHEFWPDHVSFADVELGGVVGHRQVTDAYLAQLARSRGGQLLTLDSGLAHLHGDVAVLIPTDG
jgi:predicted nucleic acid-binding protein